MKLLTNQGTLMPTSNNTKARLKKTWHLFKKGEKKASVYFFWCFTLGLLSLFVNHQIFNTISAANIVILMAVIGLSGYGAFTVFRQMWHQHKWYRCIVPIAALIRKINPHKVVVFSAFVLLGLLLGQYVFAGEQLRWINPTKPAGEGIVVSTNFNTTFIKGNTANLPVQHGYYGFGVGAGYQWALGDQHYLTGELQFNQHSKSTFTDRSGQQFSTSLNDIGLLLWHHYRATDRISVGGITGVAFGWGFNDHPKASPRFYRNLLPIAGMGTAIKLTPNLSITARYLHYFGKKDMYQSKGALPSIERFSIGASYVF